MSNLRRRVSVNNLHEVSKQEVINFIGAHLLTQNKKALNTNGECCYLNSDGLKCAAGCLLPKNHPSVNAFVTWWGLVGLNAVPEAHQNLISHLQDFHDRVDTVFWENDLVEQFGFERNLRMSDYELE